MNKSVYWIIGFFGLLLGIAAAFTSLELSVAAVLGLVGLVFLLLDYQRVTYIVAGYLILDYTLRLVFGYGLISNIWDELFFIFCICLWGYKWFVFRKKKPFKATPLDIPLALFIALGIFLAFYASPDLKIGIEGLRVVVEYMFWFFAISQLLKTPKGAKHLVYLLVFVGFVISLDGIQQYIRAVPMPANWVDKAEASVRTRVFSIVGSPNILGSLMVLLIPVSLSLVYFEKKLAKKILFLAIAFSMMACMLFTMSRGAWVGFIAAILIFSILVDKRLLVPMAICSVLIVLFVPSVTNRLIYLISPEYIKSSSQGGRLGRASQGLELFKQNPLFGVGLGRFGGAVAINNKIPGAFYSDNYYLKILVEMGIVGFTSFIFLMYNVVAWSIRAIHRIKESRYKYITSGALAGMIGVLVHCLAENVFEYPAMTVYFWLLAGFIMYIGYISNSEMLKSDSQ